MCVDRSPGRPGHYRPLAARLLARSARDSIGAALPRALNGKFWGAGIAAAVFAALAVLIALATGRVFNPASDAPTVAARLAARGETIPLLVRCRDKPIKVPPLAPVPSAVREEDAVTVLCAALPWWSPPTCPSAYHELKLWGPDCAFTREMIGVERTGRFLIETLCSDKACRANTVSVGGTYLLDSPFGIRVVLQGTADAVEYRAEAHYGQLLQILGEAGLPADDPITTSSGRVGSIRELYQDAVMRSFQPPGA